MLNCRQVEARASAYLDGELGWWQRRRVEAHLLVCDMCRRYLAQLRLVIATLRRLGEASAAPAPAGLVEQLMRGLLPPGTGP